MESGIWGWLCSEDGSCLALKLRIPEVAVFRGSRLEGWYGSNNGTVPQRYRKGVSVLSLLNSFSRMAGREVGQELTAQLADAPCAILRKRAGGAHGNSAMFHSDRLPDGLATARILTLKEFTDLLHLVEHGFNDGNIWSVQSLVTPADGRRYLVHYSCDATGDERCDVFSRAFDKAYPLPGTVPRVPLPEEAAAQSAGVHGPKRQVLEAKTLNIVRFTARFHHLEPDGLLLEFVFDEKERPVLHGCWIASMATSEGRRRAKGQGRPASAGQRRGASDFRAELAASHSSPALPSEESQHFTPDYARSPSTVELSSHWGIDQEEGIMKSQLLTAQVLQRLNVGRASRGGMIQMATQLDLLQGLQRAWEEQVATARAKIACLDEDTRSQVDRLSQLREEVKAVTHQHEHTLAETCREGWEEADVFRVAEHTDRMLESNVRRRCAELEGMEELLKDKISAVQTLLDSTVENFGEMAKSCAELELEANDEEEAVAEDEFLSLLAARRRAKDLGAEVDWERRQLEGTKEHIVYLRQVLEAERKHSLKLERFLRALADMPRGRIRTGGGYASESAVKSEAKALMAELGLG